MRLSRVTCCCTGAILLLSACRSGRGPAVYVPSRTGMESTFAGLSSRRVLDAAMHYPNKSVEQVAEVPMSLTASDGTGLGLVSLSAKAVIQGPIAFTELHLGFRNPEDRVIEGRFTITLPPRAAISRFAMKLGEDWQEAEVVERKAAQQIYEDYLHRRQDPALLEKKAGNQFNARIFPIPPRGVKEIIISYSQQMVSREQPYRLYLKGLPRIDSVEITAMVGEQSTRGQASTLGGESITHRLVRVQKQGFVPDRDFEVPVAAGPAGLVHKNLGLLRIQPKLPGDKASLDSLMVLVDTSASRAAGFYQQVAQLGAVLAELRRIYGDDPPLLVACFDQIVDSVYQGRLGDFSRQDLDGILARRPLGASNLQRALQWAGQTRGFRRLLLVGDGISTAGDTEGEALVGALKRLGGNVQRADVLLVGGIRDEATTRSLVSGTLEQDGLVLDGDQPAARIADRLSRRTVSGIQVAVDGARFVWPPQLDSLQPGDEALVFAELPEGRGFAGGQMTVSLSGPVSGRHGASLAAVSGPLLERAWVEGRIAHLQTQRDRGTRIDPDLKGALARQIVELSVKHRVLSDLTALLVLETEADYDRYNIPRTALSDILVVGASGVELQHRARPVWGRMPPPRPDDELSIRRPPRPAQGAGRDGDRLRERLVRDPRPTPAVPEPPKAAPAPAQAESAPPVREEQAPRKAAESVGDLATSGATGRDSRSAAPPAEVIERPRRDREEEEEGRTPALAGHLAEVVSKINRGAIEDGLVDALRWRAEEPADVMALIGLGEALQANGNRVLAARVYGSIIDLFPSRADMLRFAGQRLEALGEPGLELAVNAYQLAAKQRPDHASGHHLLGLALARLGRLDEAVAALEAGVKQQYRIARPGVGRVLLEDLGLVAAALAAKKPDLRGDLGQRLQQHGGRIADRPSLRFVITWETDANDVDFHIRDDQGGHAFYSARTLPSGGELFADVTNGYGPECFAIDGPARAYPYRLKAHYYSKGPMGYGMGKLQIIQHDGKGGLRFEDRPFVVMNDRAFVDLGIVKGDL